MEGPDLDNVRDRVFAHQSTLWKGGRLKMSYHDEIRYENIYPRRLVLSRIS